MQDYFVPIFDQIILLGASQKVFSEGGFRVSSIFQPFIWFWLRWRLGKQLQQGQTLLSPVTSTSTRRHFQTSREIESLQCVVGVSLTFIRGCSICEA